MSRVLVRSDIKPRPPIEAAFLHVCYVIRDKIVAQFVTFIDGGPKLTGVGMHGKADGVPYAGSIDASRRTVGIGFQNVCSMKLFLVRVRIVDVRLRSDRDVHLLAIA